MSKFPLFYKKSKNERLSIRKDARENIEAKAWLSIIFPKPPMDDLPVAKPARKRTNLGPLEKLPPEGWVYIIAASRHASIMKIGSTFEHGVRDRLSEAKRWALAGSAVLLHKEWFSRCKQAESLVHKRLDYCRIVSPDAGDELLAGYRRHARGNSLFEGKPGGKFTDVSLSAGVTMGRWAWGSKFVDFNNDGRDDILVANGFITTEDTGDL